MNRAAVLRFVAMADNDQEGVDHDRVISLLQGDNDMTQQDIAEEVGCAQSTVSAIKRSHESGMDKGREKGYAEGYEEAAENYFGEDDETPKEEEDEFWCNYCMEETGEKVDVEYMADECPNGHDLSDDWGSF